MKYPADYPKAKHPPVMAETQRNDDARTRRRSIERRPTQDGERTRSGAATRRRILEVAVQVFAEKGYHESRISDIARRAGIAYGLVYHYFRNKDEILDEIFRERWEEFIQAVRRIAAMQSTVDEKLLSLAMVILSARRRNPEWVKVLTFEIQRTQRMLAPERIARVSELFRLTAQMLRDGQARGELREDVDAELACHLFLGGLDSLVTVRAQQVIGIDERRDASERAYHLRLARTVVSLFLKGMS
jgi:AcrR family transcriptional regulator